MEKNLLSEYPEVAKQWNYAKNNGLTPDQVPPKTAKKAWWICDRGHEWEARIANRTSLSRGCPVCGCKVVSKYRNLLTEFPELCKEWCYEKNELGPENYLPFSSYKVYWKCFKNSSHIWKTSIALRSLLNRGCPYCAHRKVSEEISLLTKYPEVVKYWSSKNTTSPADWTYCSNQKVWWKCNKGHEFEAAINNKVRRFSSCPYCWGRYVCPENALGNVYPVLASEWDYAKNENLTPFDVTKKSCKKVWWICKNNSEHSWQATIANRTRYLRLGCPKCFNRENNLEIKAALILSEYFPELVKCDKELLEGARYRPDFELKHFGHIVYVNVDGLYWHCELTKDKNHHIKCRQAFEDNNKRLLQFYADEIVEKSNIFKSLILNSLGMVKNRIFARKCILAKVSKSISIEFLNNNHLMGAAQEGVSNLGLFYNNELVSLLSYRKRKNHIEISRFCSKLETVVVGGFSKLLKELKKIARDSNITRIESFCDLRYATGSGYEKVGFKRVSVSLGWQWTDRYHRFNRLKCRAGNGKTEAENAADLDWVKIYDAGQAKYVLEL